jgi:hypothetical protein
MHHMLAAVAGLSQCINCYNSSDACCTCSWDWDSNRLHLHDMLAARMCSNPHRCARHTAVNHQQACVKHHQFAVQGSASDSRPDCKTASLGKAEHCAICLKGLSESRSFTRWHLAHVNATAVTATVHRRGLVVSLLLLPFGLCSSWIAEKMVHSKHFLWRALHGYSARLLWLLPILHCTSASVKRASPGQSKVLCTAS